MKYIVFCTFFLFSCGFLGGLSTNSSSSSLNFLDSRAKDESTGVYNNPAGRLESGSRCSENKDCVKMCDTMLRRLAHQEKCYKKKENEVQELRDTYNLLALGRPEKLVEIEPEEMENFLDFGPELFQDAIYGFERQRKKGCEVETNPEDPRDREDCKLENYYRQDGYFSPGASHALAWIARNNWLAKLILEYDKDDLSIMLSLLDVLAHGGGQNLGDENKRERETKYTGGTENPGIGDRQKTCNFDGLNEPDMDAPGTIGYGTCNDTSEDGKNGGRFNCTLDTSPTTEDTSIPTNNKLDILTENRDGSSGGTPHDCTPDTDGTKHGLLAIDVKTGKACTENSLQSEKIKNQYKAFGAECLKDNQDERQTYMLLAVKGKNTASINLGHQVVRNLCSGGNTKCVKYFHCFTYSSNDDRDEAENYIGTGSDIDGWDTDTLECLF